MHLRKENDLWYKNKQLCLPPGNDTLITVILHELHDQTLEATLVLRRLSKVSLKDSIGLPCGLTLNYMSRPVQLVKELNMLPRNLQDYYNLYLFQIIPGNK
jgi:hypothetical protein